MTTRRSFITGLISFAVTAPAIVRASSLMPVKVMDGSWLSAEQLLDLASSRLTGLHRVNPLTYQHRITYQEAVEQGWFG